MNIARDPGLQPERTVLAWRRTALALLVNGALVLRAAVQGESPTLAIAAALVLAAAAVVVALTFRRDRELQWPGAAPAVPPARLVALVACAAILACAAAAWSIIR